MATALAAGAVAFKPFALRFSSCSSQQTTTSSISGTPLFHNAHAVISSRINCQQKDGVTSPEVSRRNLLKSVVVTGPILAAAPAFALLESDEDLELLSKVKESRKKREASQKDAKNNQDESAAVQDAVNRLAKAGQALDNGDFEEASSVLGSGSEVTWVSNVNEALTKIGSKGKEKKAAADFKNALKALQSSVAEKNSEAAKSHFVTAAQALESWSDLTGLAATLQGL